MFPNQLPQRVQIGVVGGGVTSAVGRVHLSALRLTDAYEVVGGAFSSDREVGKESAKAYGLSPDKACHDLEDLVTRFGNRLDAIVVLTPTPMHYAQVKTILNSGISVICEKSLTTSLRDAEDLASTVLEGQSLFVTFNYSAYPMVREARERILGGHLGKLHSLRISMPSEYFARSDASGAALLPQPWRQRDYELPTVSLDLGVHVVHLAHFLTGSKAVDLVGHESRKGRVQNVVDSVQGIANYDGSIDVSYDFGKVFLGHRNGLAFHAYGSKGRISWYQQVPDVLSVSDQFGNRSELDPGSVGLVVADSSRYARFKAGHPSGFVEAFANLYEDFAAALTDTDVAAQKVTSGLVPSAREAVAGLAELEAVHASAEQRMWVTVPPTQ